MLIGHSMPVVTAVELTGGSWLTADAGAALHDGKPARKARIQAAGAPSITLQFGHSARLRVVAVLGLAGVAEGSAVSASSASGNASGTVWRFADGSLGAWLLLPASAASSAVSVSLAASGQVDIGEIIAMPAVDVAIQPGWVAERIDDGNDARTRAGVPIASSRASYRRLAAELVADTPAQVRGGGLADGADWEQLAAAMAGNARICGIVRGLLPSGAIDAAELNRTAIYGTGRIGQIPHASGPWYRGSLEIMEIPAT